MPKSFLASLSVFFAAAMAFGDVRTNSTPNVAVIQLRSSKELSKNVERIANHIRDAANRGAEVVVFPECALTGYFDDVIRSVSHEQLSAAEKQIAEACKQSSVCAIVGTPFRADQKIYNSALVLSPSGDVIERYHKIHLAETWPEPGDHLSVFKIRGVPCSIMICHDERYPELVRLPVLAGAKVIFYISHESDLRQEHKLAPYRAQIQARAVENNVFVVHANAPANKDAGGSHGQSRIIGPDGNIVKEASIFDEDVLAATLDLRKATQENAKNSLKRGPLTRWWDLGVKEVRLIE